MAATSSRPTRGADRPSVTILYHFFHPDDVVSARHFSDLAEELVRRGWNVDVLTSDRYCRYPDKRIPADFEIWNKIRIFRVHRPALDQSRNIPRLLNTTWMLSNWAVLSLFRRGGLFLIGTDPQFSQVIFPVLKRASRKNRLVLWSFDLYPDAIIADRPSGLEAFLARAAKPFMKRLYQHVDVAVDIGACMRRRLDTYGHSARRETLTPWALVEPSEIQAPDPAVRQMLFGDAKLGIFYSGNLGKAHQFRAFLELARRVSRLHEDIAFCFACRGNRAEEFKASITDEDQNIRIAPFAKESELGARLSAADIHLLSLRPEWAGIVVPSKFFGSLAAGRPVLYAGPRNSAIGTWIEEFDVGFTLDSESLDTVAEKLVDLADDPKRMEMWKKNAFHAYHTHFSKEVVMDRWDVLLREEHARLRG